MTRLLILAAALSFAAAPLATAQDSPKPSRLPKEAPTPKKPGPKPAKPVVPDAVTPTWEIGQWWEVAVDLKQARGPRGLGADLPELELPGLARRGPRPGFSEVARWRLRVSKTQRFAVPEAEDGSWYLGWFVEARRIDREARRPTSLTLVFVGEVKALSDIGIRSQGRKLKWLSYDADAILEAPIAPALQLLPLAWPDLRGGPRLKGRGHLEEEVLQRRSEDKSGVYFDLRGKLDPRVGAAPAQANIRWRMGEPWPAKITGQGFEVRLLRTSKATTRKAEGPR